jgi:type I restriction enzyme S subunit
MSWDSIAFSELVEFPPKVSLEKDELYDNIPMDVVDGGIKYVQEINQRVYTGGGAKFGNGDTIFARITPCLENGKIAKVKGLEKGVGFGSTEFFVFRAKENISDPDFIYYLAKTELVRQPAIKSMVGASGRQRADKGVVEQIKVPNIPLPTQRKIASILSAYDDLIENNLKRIKLMEEKAQLHYKIEFGEYQFGYKEPRNLPKGWSIKSIGDIYGKLESGSRPKGGIDKELKEGIASVGAENVIGLGKYNYQSEKLITEAFFENMNRGKIENKDILIYKDGAYIGKTTLFQDDFPHEKCCVNEHVFLLRSKDELYQNYLFFTLYQKLYFDKMQQLNANAAQPGINQESLKSLRILWPSENIIEEFNQKVESLMKLIFVVAKQNTKLREARDILLPKLMNGQIEV